MAPLAGDPRSVLKGTWSLAAVAIVVMVLRVVAKLKLHHVGIDDCAMITALLLALVASTLFSIAVLVYGFGDGLDTHNHSDQVNALKYYVILQVFGIASSCMGRVAFIFYLLPILSTTKISKIILRGLLALQVVNFVSIVLLLSQCRDIRGIWDPLFEERTECMDVSVEIYYGYFQCSCNGLTDLILSVYPSYIFWNLKLRLRVKISLVILISLGLLSMVAAIMKATYLEQIITYGSTATCWAMIESYLVIITASIPCLRSFIVSSARQLFASDHSGTFHLTSSSRKRGSARRLNSNRSGHRMKPDAIQPSAEASGSMQNFFGETPIEEVELGSNISENDHRNLNVLERSRGGIAKSVSVSVTWDGDHNRVDNRR
ncbi:hypothetical protein BDV41DRAFT_570638 [Aspergillus transmontanensis]|uniref:Rhodopsin domain-containing protein n=1 Tax=Aspergillus transmontanensis TaxID=1034304 RepID=A0A5N6WIY6_9EURO|nr:hypothetical protein BDV41DRAFT_570638 [Aspergillus transmontanensis]